MKINITKMKSCHYFIANYFPFLTLLLICINVYIFFFYQLPMTNGDSLTLFWLYKQGANIGPLSLTDESWRLLYSIFLHADTKHLFLNMLFLFVVGSRVEIQSGRLNFIYIYLIGGLFASYMSAVFYLAGFSESISIMGARGYHIVISVGASGAILALYGYLFCEIKRLPTSVQKKAKLAYFIGLLPLFVIGNNIDMVAHIAGFLFGYINGIICFNLQSHRHRKKYLFFWNLFISGFVLLLCFNATSKQDAKMEKRKAIVFESFKKDEIDLIQKIQLNKDLQYTEKERERFKAIEVNKSDDYLTNLESDFIRKMIATTQQDEFLILANTDNDERSVAGIYRYNLNKNKIIDTIIEVPLSEFSPGYISYLAGELSAYEGDSLQEQIKKIDDEINSDNYLKLACPHNHCFGVGAADMVVSRDGKIAYVTGLERGSVSIIDLASKKIINSKKISEAPKNIAIDEDNIYVIDPSMFAFFILDKNTLVVKQTIKWYDYRFIDILSSTSSIFINGNMAYFIDNYGAVYQVNLLTNKIGGFPDIPYAINIGQNKTGEIWILTSKYVYYLQSKKKTYFDCQNEWLKDKWFNWYNRDYVLRNPDMTSRQVTLIELDNKTLVVERYENNDILFGYSLETGQLLRKWIVPDFYYLKPILEYNAIFFPNAFNYSTVLDTNKSLPISEQERNKYSLGKYSCLLLPESR